MGLSSSDVFEHQQGAGTEDLEHAPPPKGPCRKRLGKLQIRRRKAKFGARPGCPPSGSVPLSLPLSLPLSVPLHVDGGADCHA
ncbi:GL20774 [Drosophila persimilis]|uniref:GL20774 n=1 Tax=Drosophila persimilis TaxID=7234 RepID=B4H3Y9_DROPE|nr:GL20774 [Drosophila persimilis]